MRKLVIDALCSRDLLSEITPRGLSNSEIANKLYDVPDREHEIWENHSKFIVNIKNEKVVNPIWQNEIDLLTSEVKQLLEKLNDEDLIKLFESTIIFANR